MAKQYSNRSDLRNPAGKIAKQAAKGQPYGEATKQMQSQSAVPMGAAPTDAPQRVQPGQMGRLDRPTERPDQPVTSGSPFGPGRTPDISMMPPRNTDPVLNELRALYMQFPSEELADMLDSYVREGY